ncbi:MAG: argininosuccinate lyase [Acidobacteria bacterium]|nr:argininosuccinate lyase [Thermoanaerobaculia bacterium]NLN10297.1 argininosuccinate lyase [Acidobacteriota bacterium]MBP7812518.1 argininosuccinate lyase [Thermoanaerobaculia bacterium]HPA95578.1 lyase family protein [Thermoanaerobaculia bacterium]HQN38390.1 lyase family protein [Thermoanaerobaculia bacterium]
MSRLWDLGGALDARVLAYTAGEDHALDDRLIAHDVTASLAHAAMLHGRGLLADGDFAAIRDGLAALGDEHARGLWRVELADEDGHTALERRLTARIGAAGGRLHLGRSRNDQVLAALRLWMRAEAAALAGLAREVAAALGEVARLHDGVALPGYTHLQPAMPSSVPLWAGGFAAELEDDAAGLAACARRIEKNPLGSAAGYGTPGLALDREATRAALGFAAVHEPVTAVQLSRGKAEAQLLFEVHLLTQDLGRLAADLVWYASKELGFVALPPAMTTGSSLMPQKRNPDLFELARAAGAVTLGALVEALALPAKLPSGYHRDLQRLKAPLFRACDLARATAGLFAATLPEIRFLPERIALPPELGAAEEAHRLVLAEGIPFREAYRRVAARYRPE